MVDYHLAGPSPERGAGPIAIDTQALMGKAPTEVTVESRNRDKRRVDAAVRRATWLEMEPRGAVVDYILR